MGFLSFVKDAGEKINGTSAELEQKLVAKVENFDLKVENLEISVTGDKAVAKGIVENQIIKEKTGLVLGNTSGIAEVDNQIEIKKTEVGSETKEAQHYTVVSGDTLGKIAKEYYGDPMKYPEIVEANQPMLKDANSIFPGQVLRIPSLN